MQTFFIKPRSLRISLGLYIITQFQGESPVFDPLLGIVRSRSRSWWDFFPFTTIQTIRSYNSTLVEASKLILNMYVHPITIHNTDECRHA